MGQKPGQTGNPNGRPTGSQNKVTAQLKDIMTKFCNDYLTGDFQADFQAMSETDRVKVSVDLVKHFVPKAKDESEKELEATATSALRRLFLKGDE